MAIAGEKRVKFDIRTFGCHQNSRQVFVVKGFPGHLFAKGIPEPLQGGTSGTHDSHGQPSVRIGVRSEQVVLVDQRPVQTKDHDLYRPGSVHEDPGLRDTGSHRSTCGVIGTDHNGYALWKASGIRIGAIQVPHNGCRQDNLGEFLPGDLQVFQKPVIPVAIAYSIIKTCKGCI